MIGPSIHLNGIHLHFTVINQEASEAAYDDLLKSVSFLATCSEITQLWGLGRRHDLALSFSGICLKQNLNPQLLINIIQSICQVMGDRDEQDRIKWVWTIVGTPHDELRGYQGLASCIGKAATDRVAKLIGVNCGTEERSLSVVKEVEVEVSHCGRFTERANLINGLMEKQSLLSRLSNGWSRI